MAGTVQTSTLYADPKFMQDSFQEDGRNLVEMDDAVAQLARIIHKKSSELSMLFSDRSESRYLKVAENLDENTVEQIQKLNLPGIGVTPIDHRYYPMKSLASHLLGGVGKDGKGLEGLELKCEKLLAGVDGYQCVLKDAHRRAIAVAAEGLPTAAAWPASHSHNRCQHSIHRRGRTGRHLREARRSPWRSGGDGSQNRRGVGIGELADV